MGCSSSSPSPDDGSGANNQGGSQQHGSGGGVSTGSGGTGVGTRTGGGGGADRTSDASTGPVIGPDATSTPGNYQSVQVFQTSRNAGMGSKPEHCDTVAPLTLHASGASTRSVVTIDATKPKQKI